MMAIVSPEKFRANIPVIAASIDSKLGQLKRTLTPWHPSHYQPWKPMYHQMDKIQGFEIMRKLEWELAKEDETVSFTEIRSDYFPTGLLLGLRFDKTYLGETIFAKGIRLAAIYERSIDVNFTINGALTRWSGAVGSFQSQSLPRLGVEERLRLALQHAQPVVIGKVSNPITQSG